MENSILNFNKQFDFDPEIQNAESVKDFDHIILCGMGGSHLAADLIKTIKPGVDIYVHKDYDLPPYEEDFLRRGLLIACSYSGNTEETVSFMEQSLKEDYAIAIISTGGVLLETAKTKEVPFIEIPNDGIQPRQADAYLAISILKLMGDDDTLSSWSLLSEKINPVALKETGKDLAKEIGKKIPIIYSSNRNLHVAYNWKITMNETAKIPAFYNVFPELNHNEMQGFGDENLNKNFHIIFIRDDEDDSRVVKRMNITKEIYTEKGITVSEIVLDSKTREERVFNGVILADWVALNIAQEKGIDAEQVPMIEDFKSRLAFD
jgi:glucose/mannose-6-phosphate isomerase